MYEAIQDVPRGKINILGGHSIGHSKQKRVYMYVCPIPNGTVPKLLIRKRYYVLFPIPVYIVQVTKLIQFT
jgi:hypothetical protein